MSSFKDFLKYDVKRTFLNVNEFADTHIIDKKQITAIINDDTEDQNPLSYAEGVSLVKKTIYLDPDDLGYVPVQDQRMEIDCEYYTVAFVGKEDGMLVIKVEANKA